MPQAPPDSSGAPGRDPPFHSLVRFPFTFVTISTQSPHLVDTTLHLVGSAPLTVEGQLLIGLDPDDVETWFRQERVDQRLLSSDTSPMGINI